MSGATHKEDPVYETHSAFVIGVAHGHYAVYRKGPTAAQRAGVYHHRDDELALRRAIERADLLTTPAILAEYWLVVAGDEALEVFSWEEDARTWAGEQDTATPDGAPHCVVRVVVPAREKGGTP